MRRKKKKSKEPEQDGRVVNVFTWGTGEGGQLGYGVDTPISQDVPRPAFPIGAVQGQHVVCAAAGGRHSLFLLESGEVLACGVWDDGQLGCKDRPLVLSKESAEEVVPVPESLVPRGRETFPVPVQVPAKLVVKELSAGFASSFLVTDFGEVGFTVGVQLSPTTGLHAPKYERRRVLQHTNTSIPTDFSPGLLSEVHLRGNTGMNTTTAKAAATTITTLGNNVYIAHVSGPFGQSTRCTHRQ